MKLKGILSKIRLVYAQEIHTVFYRQAIAFLDESQNRKHPEDIQTLSGNSLSFD
jgi:hypothetical protein